MDELSATEFVCYLLMVGLVLAAVWLHKKTETIDRTTNEKNEKPERDIDTKA
jgi:hypothetical protein